MAIGAGGSGAVSVDNGSSVNALLVEFDWMSKGNFVTRQKLRITVTGGAGVGQIFLSNS